MYMHRRYYHETRNYMVCRCVQLYKYYILDPLNLKIFMVKPYLDCMLCMHLGYVHNN